MLISVSQNENDVDMALGNYTFVAVVAIHLFADQYPAFPRTSASGLIRSAENSGTDSAFATNSERLDDDLRLVPVAK